jgi:hypothetical protein
MLKLTTAGPLDIATLRRAVELVADGLLTQIRNGEDRASVTWAAGLLLVTHPKILEALAHDPVLRGNMRIIIETPINQRSGPVYRDEVEACATAAIWEARQQLAPPWTDPSSAVTTDASPQ